MIELNNKFIQARIINTQFVAPSCICYLYGGYMVEYLNHSASTITSGQAEGGPGHIPPRHLVILGADRFDQEGRTYPVTARSQLEYLGVALPRILLSQVSCFPYIYHKATTLRRSPDLIIVPYRRHPTNKGASYQARFYLRRNLLFMVLLLVFRKCFVLCLHSRISL